MSERRGLKGWNREYSSVIVGVDMDTKEVCRIHVQKDNVMVRGELSHFPLGLPTMVDALVVFGVAHARQFAMTNLDDADAYAEKLRLREEEEEEGG